MSDKKSIETILKQQGLQNRALTAQESTLKKNLDDKLEKKFALLASNDEVTLDTNSKNTTAANNTVEEPFELEFSVNEAKNEPEKIKEQTGPTLVTINENSEGFELEGSEGKNAPTPQIEVANELEERNEVNLNDEIPDNVVSIVEDSTREVLTQSVPTDSGVVLEARADAGEIRSQSNMPSAEDLDYPELRDSLEVSAVSGVVPDANSGKHTNLNLAKNDEIKLPKSEDLEMPDLNSKNDDQKLLELDADKNGDESFSVENDRPVSEQKIVKSSNKAIPDGAEDIKRVPDATQFVASNNNRSKMFETMIENEQVSQMVDLSHLQSNSKILKEEREKQKEQILNLENELSVVTSEKNRLAAELDEMKIEIKIIKKRSSDEIDSLKNNLRVVEEKKDVYKEKNSILKKEFERLNQKVLIDLNKIQEREKFLENQVEMLKLDASSQIESRDKKILELKRRIDILEFDMDTISSKDKKVVEEKYLLENKLEKAIKTLREAIEVLEVEEIDFEDEKKLKRLKSV
ncbi:MAG: hypothetical protein U0T83_01735 [Bacteriovoracaceae bacterium]